MRTIASPAMLAFATRYAARKLDCGAVAELNALKLEHDNDAAREFGTPCHGKRLANRPADHHGIRHARLTGDDFSRTADYRGNGWTDAPISAEELALRLAIESRHA